MTLAAPTFARPERLAPFWHSKLMGWGKSALALAAKSWPKSMPFELSAEIQAVETAKAEPALKNLPDGSFGFRIHLGPEKIPTLWIVQRSLALSLISGLLGEAEIGEKPERDLTLVEDSLADYFVQASWTPFFKESWPSLEETSWEVGPREPNPQVTRLFAPADPLVVFSFEFKGPFGAKPSYWLFPQKGLMSLLDHDEPTPERAPVHVGNQLEALVRNLPLDVTVILGTVEVPLAQLANLQRGDVILLEQRISEPLAAYLGDKPFFRGWPTRTGSYQAFAIDSLLDQ
jgi:flagellar motor switch protein FliM